MGEAIGEGAGVVTATRETGTEGQVVDDGQEEAASAGPGGAAAAEMTAGVMTGGVTPGGEETMFQAPGRIKRSEVGGGVQLCRVCLPFYALIRFQFEKSCNLLLC